MTSVLSAALDYAGRGWPVLPIWWPLGEKRCACRDRGCTSPGKHPHSRLAPHGLDDASTDTDIINRWFTRFPELNIGLRTGIAFDVLDVDGADAAHWLACLAVVKFAAGDWRGGPMSITANGTHLLYLPTGAGNRTAMGGQKGVDWRGAGGYIVAPPSRHHLGHVYRWAAGNGPDEPLEPASGFLVELVDPPRREPPPSRPWSGGLPRLGGWSPAGLINLVATASEGRRNDALNWAAFKYGNDVHDGRVGQDRALVELDVLGDTARRVGLGNREINKTIRSGYRAGLQGRAR